MQRLQAEGREAPLPPVDVATHLLSHLLEVGPLQAGGMAPAALSEFEIAAWQSNTGQRLTPWECRTLKRLSREYLAQHHEAEDPDCPPPWGAPEEPDRDAISRKVTSILSPRARRA